MCINLFYFVTGLLKKRKKRPYCDENYFKKKKEKKICVRLCKNKCEFLKANVEKNKYIWPSCC